MSTTPQSETILTWNYRVVQHFFEPAQGNEAESEFRVYECYYDDNGRLNGWTKELPTPGGSTPDELRDDLRRMAEALDRPFLRLTEDGNLTE